MLYHNKYSDIKHFGFLITLYMIQYIGMYCYWWPTFVLITADSPSTSCTPWILVVVLLILLALLALLVLIYIGARRYCCNIPNNLERKLRKYYMYSPQNDNIGNAILSSLIVNTPLIGTGLTKWFFYVNVSMFSAFSNVSHSVIKSACFIMVQ